MVSFLKYEPVLARTFIIVQSAFFLFNFERSNAFTALQLSDHGGETGESKRDMWNGKYGALCHNEDECDFQGAICSREEGKCKCQPEHPATNRFDKCGKAANINNTCEFDEQCEYSVWNSMCKDKRCVCRGDGKLTTLHDGTVKCVGKRFGDSCNDNEDCAFKWAECDPNKKSCQCQKGLKATNHLDKCGEARKVNEECFFNEQCEHELFGTFCSNGICSCRLERIPFMNPDGSIKCIALEQPSTEVRSDPTMIIVLSVMCLMFVIICVVLHLFSKARWRDNRTIFNTPNPRLMNVSLLREKKIERRGSKEGSVKGPPSREPSMASLRHHSPSIESRSDISRRESRGVNSNESAKSPTSRAPPSAASNDVITPLTSDE